ALVLLSIESRAVRSGQGGVIHLDTVISSRHGAAVIFDRHPDGVGAIFYISVTRLDLHLARGVVEGDGAGSADAGTSGCGSVLPVNGCRVGRNGFFIVRGICKGGQGYGPGR